MSNPDDGAPKTPKRETEVTDGRKEYEEDEKDVEENDPDEVNAREDGRTCRIIVLVVVVAVVVVVD